MTSHGAVELGRGVVVLPGDGPPAPWSSCPRVLIDDASLEKPGPVAEELHGYWFDRRPVVVELGVDQAELRAPEVCRRPVYELTPHFEFGRERLQFLVWANNYDARGGVPIWWHGRKAARRGAAEGVREVEDEAAPGDIVLADGTRASSSTGARRSRRNCASGIEVVHRWNAEAGTAATGGSAVHAPCPSWRRTSWPRSTTAPGRPGSSPRRVRERPGC